MSLPNILKRGERKFNMWIASFKKSDLPPKFSLFLFKPVLGNLAAGEPFELEVCDEQEQA